MVAHQAVSVKACRRGLGVEAPFPGEAAETSGELGTDPVRSQLIDHQHQDQPGDLLRAGRPGEPGAHRDDTEKSQEDPEEEARHGGGS
jgi:hypothetical protein